MSKAETDLRVFLSPHSGLPPTGFGGIWPDVIFLVQGEDGETGGEKIGAHSQFLAAVSPVFRGMFFGPMKETAEFITVKETTPEAFNTMISYIYKPLGNEFNLSHISCPQKLFELLNLANKYQISSLATLAADALKNLVITRDNMIFTATVGKNYRTAFEDVSFRVLEKCLEFLYETTIGAADIFTLISKTLDNFPGASLDILRDLMDVKENLHPPGLAVMSQ